MHCPPWCHGYAHSIQYAPPCDGKRRQAFNHSQCTKLKGDAKEKELPVTVCFLNLGPSPVPICTRTLLPSLSQKAQARPLYARTYAPQAKTLLGAVRAFSSGSTRKRRLGPSRHTLGWPNSASTVASTPDTTRAACMCTKPARDHASLISR